MKRVPVVLSACLSAAGIPAEAQRPQALQQFVAVEAPVVALTHVKVIDGTGGPIANDQTIIIEGDRIAAVGNTGSVFIPIGTDLHDLSGHTVIPGIIGLHNHSYYTASGGRAAQLSFSGSRLYLASGVTTIRTTGPWERCALARLDAFRSAKRCPKPATSRFAKREKLARLSFRIGRDQE